MSILLIILVIAGGVYAVQRHNRPADKSIAQVVYSTEKTADQAVYAQLKKTPPTAKASVDEQATYFDKLEQAAADVGDYQGATTAFDRRSSIKADDLTYERYVEAAFYYNKAGITNMAVIMIDRAILLLPKQDNPNELYYYQGELSRLNDLRAEYNQ